jgi:hypothetical protein
MLSTGKPRNSHSPLTLRAEGNNCRNQAITLKCPAQGHDECNGDVSTVATLGGDCPSDVTHVTDRTCSSA